MAPPKNLVTAVCVILAVPISYAIYQTGSVLVAAVTLVVVGIVIPQLYARFAVPMSETDQR